MAKYQLRTFKDIIDKVCEQLKIQTSDLESRRRIRRNINSIYLDEVIPYKTWTWLRGNRTLQTEPYFGLGTASVVQSSVTVTLTQAPPTSRKGHFFCTTSGAENYRISSHTAGSYVIILETPFADATNATSTYRIWTDSIPLPSDAKEVVEITHQYSDRPLENLGLQEFRRVVANAPHAESRPRFYTTLGVKDPDPFSAIAGFPASVSRASNGLVKTITFAANLDSYIAAGDSILVSSGANYSYNIEAVVSSVSGTSLTYTATVAFQEATTADITFSITKRGSDSYEGYRELLVYPSVSDKRTTLHVDYQRNAEPLENDSDEPLMPIEDRITLFYGAMWLSCDRERNPEWATQNFQLFERKLNRMAGKTDDTPDKPILKPSSQYLLGKRFGSRRRDLGSSGASFSGSGSTTPTGTANSVAIFDGNGDLLGSSTISTTALAFLLGAEGGQSAAIQASQASNVVIESWSATTYKAAHIAYYLLRGSVYESGTIYVTTNGASAAITVSCTSSVGSSGVTFDADVSAGKIRLLYTSDGSGPIGSMSYRVLLF